MTDPQSPEPPEDELLAALDKFFDPTRGNWQYHDEYAHVPFYELDELGEAHSKARERGASSSDELRAALLGAEEALRRLVSDGWSAASERQALNEADNIRAAFHASRLDADKEGEAR